VTRAIPFLAGLALAIVVFAGTGAQAAGAGQTVAFVLRHNAASSERLPVYRAAAPIRVKVRGDAGGMSAMRVTATGPGGRAVSAPLVKHGDTFTGALDLTQPGTWSLALTTQLGSMTAALAAVPLRVVAEDGADIAARIAYALSALSIGAGITLLWRARRGGAVGAV
jgi:hypothetical protein